MDSTRSAKRSTIRSTSPVDSCSAEGALVSASDILKILDQVPWWKALRSAPERLDALEKRVADLEARLASPAPTPGQPCPACGQPALRRTGTKPMAGELGELGGKVEAWTCTNCGAVDERTVLPGR